MLKVPCKNCPFRHTGCHATCEKYKEFQEKNEALRDIKNKESMLNMEYIAFRKSGWRN